jgi:hypothetical protein
MTAVTGRLHKYYMNLFPCNLSLWPYKVPVKTFTYDY